VTSVDPATETPSPETSEATEQTVSDAVTTETFTEELKQGDNDPIIAEIQARLMELGYMDSDEPTEHFGPLTQSALKTFQRHNGLDDDGICGQTTYTTLMSETAKIYVMQNGDSGEDVWAFSSVCTSSVISITKPTCRARSATRPRKPPKNFRAKTT
jgi:peptidoglycan hydrolase-like protein with peptidoglycan-binding domain